MHLHSGTYENRPAFLFVDGDERIIELPTEFLRSLAREATKVAPGTLHRYAEKIRDLCVFLICHAVFGQLRVDDAIRNLNRSVLNEFYVSLQAVGQEATTVRLAEAAIKRFTNWLNTDEAGYAHSRPLYPENAEALTPAPTKRLPRYLTAADVTNLQLKLHYEAQRLVVHFIYDTGLRVSEVPRVLKIDLPDWRHYPEGQMYFPLFVRGSKGRGGQLKDRYTMISRPLLSRIARHHNTKAYQFNFDFEDNEKPALLNVFGERWTNDAIEALLMRARDRAKLPDASAHRLRHGTAFSVLTSNHGKSMLDNLVILQKMFGHTDISTTEVYTAIPAPVLEQIRTSYGSAELLSRFEQAQAIFDETYVPEKKEPPKHRIGRSA
ncbi:tyrosine-type recombinase/integrase [Ralstonia pseudosolanacearum]|uniref:tyrosine-type recombinase/integrase n=1 Tax=Ralstonia pseudosolanacearum TaxID=1310165 RepID=UPI002675CE66|nr:tyrosine-type recombinase/integrase [Ralstonia pseudosolanacearum]MDO3623578.1 tyrosine-type recombinase/integrase [Ralstonia pseudosolanacearum]